MIRILAAFPVVLLYMSGCCQIPGQMPTFIQDNNRILETRIETLATAIQTAANSSKKAHESLDVVKTELRKKDPNMTVINLQLSIVEQSVVQIESLRDLADRARADAKSLVDNYSLVIDILNDEIDKRELFKAGLEKLQHLHSKEDK